MAYNVFVADPPVATTEVNQLITNVNLGIDREYYSAETTGPLTLNDGASPLSLVSYNLENNGLPEMVIVSGYVRFSSTTATNINFFLTKNGTNMGRIGSLKVASGLEFSFCVVAPLLTPGSLSPDPNAYIVKAELENASLGSVATFDYVAVTHWQL